MTQNYYKSVSICINCGKCKVCGEDCKNCTSKSDLSNATAKYAVALKEAVQCWQDAKCEDHAELCKPTLREFAEKFLEMRSRIEKLESGILTHKEIKQNPDDFDKSLWNLV